MVNYNGFSESLTSSNAPIADQIERRVRKNLSTKPQNWIEKQSAKVDTLSRSDLEDLVQAVFSKKT